MKFKLLSMKVFRFAILTIALFTMMTGISFAQLNMTLQDSLDYNVGVNDVCGWVAEDGTEYALVGLNTGVSIVDITSDTLKEVAFVPGVNNLWRDINTFGHYAYVTSEASIGLLIINLEYLPDSVQYHSWFGVCSQPGGNQTFSNAHSLAIDEYGIAFLNGSNLNSGGCVLVDVHTDPWNPTCLGYAPAVYSHDCIARDSILYSAEIWAGTASIYDYHDVQNITTLGSVETPHEFTHNIALSADGQYMFTTDEVGGSYTTGYDISDPGNIKETDRFRQASVEGENAVVHNAFMWEDWLVLAYYTSGTLIVDASRPYNLVEVGNFDSFLGGNGGYNGVWGAYPWMPSGKILASDRSNGLFVFIPNYVRAAFLEGTVIDSITGDPIFGATVTILSDEIVLPLNSNLDGTFKTGKAVPGIYPVQVEKQGYYTKTIDFDFINGNILTPVFELVQIPTSAVSGKVVYPNGEGVPYAKVGLSGQHGIYETTADADGNFLMPAVYRGQYAVDAGIWGYTTQTDISLDDALDVTLTVQQGYNDDFDIDLGWTISGDATEGQWTRGIPTSQKLYNNWQCGSAEDSQFDIGEHLYSTGLSGSDDVIDNEVSGGTTILASPEMDLDSIYLPHVSFDFWLCEFPPNQYLGFAAYWTNDQDTTLIWEFKNDTITGSWQRFDDYIDIIGPRENIKILFSATDTTSGTSDYILKVHVDNFRLTEGALGTHDPIDPSKRFKIYPNPVNGPMIYLEPGNEIAGNELSLKIYDALGKNISSLDISKNEAEGGINHYLDNGFYFIQWSTELGEFGAEKILVIKE